MKSILDPSLPKQEEIIKANIMGNTMGPRDVMPETFLRFQSEVKSGKVRSITKAQLASDHGDKFFLKSDYEAMGTKLDALIKKGEDDFLTEEEFTFLEKACDQYRNMERVGIAMEKADGSEAIGHVEAYVIGSAND